MSGEWQQPAPLWVRAIPLAVVSVGIVAAFVYMEGKRTERIVGEALRFSELLDGTATSVMVLTPEMEAGHWEQITSVETLEEVDLSGVADVGEGLASLRDLAALRSLQLNECEFVDDDRLVWLIENLALERLHVAECPRITDRSIAAIIGCETLEQVDLWGTSITIDGLAQLRDARRDMKISMNWDAFVRLPEDAQPGRKVYPSFGDSMDLLSIRVGSSDHVHRAVLALPHNWKTGLWQDEPGSQVVTLAITGYGAGAELWRLAPRLRNLGTLSVSNTYIPAKIGDWSPRLTLLSLSDLAESSDLSGFADCTSLTSVSYFDRNRSAAADLSFLEALPHLQSVSLGRPAVTLEEVELISGLSTVRAVSLYGVTDAAVGPLLAAGRLPELEELTLHDGELSGDVLEQLTSARPAMTLTRDSRSRTRSSTRRVAGAHRRRSPRETPAGSVP